MSMWRRSRIKTRGPPPNAKNRDSAPWTSDAADEQELITTKKSSQPRKLSRLATFNLPR
jgi:hypothetical protein